MIKKKKNYRLAKILWGILGLFLVLAVSNSTLGNQNGELVLPELTAEEIELMEEGDRVIAESEAARKAAREEGE